MIRTAFSPRIFFSLLLVSVLVACASSPTNATEEIPSITEEAPSEPDPSDVSTPFSPTQLPNLISTVQPAIPERRLITVEFPPRIRAGDSDRVRLTLEVDDLGNITPTAETGGNTTTGEVIEIPNLYETHRVIAEARFDIAGMQVTPPELISQPLAPGQSITFYWSVLPDNVGVYRGTIWLYLRFVENVSGEESQRVVSAQPVEIEAVNLFGIPAMWARSFGMVGTVVGAIIGFPFFEDIIKYLIGRRKKKRGM